MTQQTQRHIRRRALLLLGFLIVGGLYFAARPPQDMADVFVSQVHNDCPSCLVVFTRAIKPEYTEGIVGDSIWCADAYAINQSTFRHISAYIARRRDDSLEFRDWLPNRPPYDCSIQPVPPLLNPLLAP